MRLKRELVRCKMFASATLHVIGLVDDLIQWLVALDRSFLFLLALPFMVAVAGLAAELVRQCRLRRPPSLK